jgi:uncharacterized protein YbjT (DUF2867 family)
MNDRETDSEDDVVDPNRVLVAGATGGTGRAVLRLLAGREVRVRALTRRESARITLEEAGADEVVVGDLFDAGDAARAVEGVDAVLSTVGSSPQQVFAADELVDGAGTRTLLDAAVDAGVRAFVMESALGVGEESPGPMGRLFNAVIGPIQRAKGEAERAIRAAPVRHTILRPGVLTNGRRTDDVQVAKPGAGLWGRVSRADVARLVVAAPSTSAAADRTFEVVRNQLLRDQALSVRWRMPGED